MVKRDIPKRTLVTDEIYAKSLKVKGLLYEQFKNCESAISFTFDAGTSRAYDPYLTVTAHWIDNSWNLRDQIIAFNEIEGEHTGENTGAILVKVFHEYGILDRDKVFVWVPLEFLS
jgi:hypothetical protein